MEASYLRIPRDPRRAEDTLKSFLEVAPHDPARDWSTVCDLLSRCVTWHRATGNLDCAVVDRLADLHVYVELDDSDSTRSFRCRPAIQRLKRDAANGKLTRVFVSNVSSLGRDMREVVAAVHELTSQGITIVPIPPDAEPIGPEAAGILREVLKWLCELDHEKRSIAIRTGQTKVRARGRRVGRPKRIFDRQEVVRLRDEEQLSWSEISQALRIGVGTARRAYQDLKASPGPAKTIRGVA